MFNRAVSAIRRSTSLSRKKDEDEDRKVSDSEGSVASAISAASTSSGRSSSRRRRFFRKSTAKKVTESQSAFEFDTVPKNESTSELTGFSDATIERGNFGV